jgi:hypothetical protein
MSMYSNCQYFNPKWLPSVKIWENAHDPSANGTQPADNTSMSSWVDKSGNAFSDDQATGANQPKWRSNVGGKPAVEFTGSPVFFNSKSSSTLGIKNSPFELYFVAQTSTLTATFLASSSSTNNLWEIDFQPDGAGGTNGIGAFNPFPTIQAYAGVGNQYADGNPHIISYRAESGGSNPNYCRADGVDGAVGSNGLNNTDATLVVGKRGNSSFYLVGYIRERVLVTTQLTTVQRTLLENYFKNYWGTP